MADWAAADAAEMAKAFGVLGTVEENPVAAESRGAVEEKPAEQAAATAPAAKATSAAAPAAPASPAAADTLPVPPPPRTPAPVVEGLPSLAPGFQHTRPPPALPQDLTSSTPTGQPPSAAAAPAAPAAGPPPSSVPAPFSEETPSVFAAPPVAPAQPVLLNLSDHVPRPMSKTAANKALKQLRADSAADGAITAESRDLSDGQTFDWQAYVTSRPDYEEIIGQGIWKFECRFVNARDPNWKVLPVEHRFDFVAHRVDGSAVRLHPEQSYHGKATYGDINDWALTPAAPRSQDETVVGAPSTAVARNDTVGAFKASVWLKKTVPEPNEDFLKMVLASSRDRFDGVWWRDLTDKEDFHWHQFLAARGWGREIMDHVDLFGAAFSIRRSLWGPIFVLCMSPEAPVHANQMGVIACSGEKARLTWPARRYKFW